MAAAHHFIKYCFLFMCVFWRSLEANNADVELDKMNFVGTQEQFLFNGDSISKIETGIMNGTDCDCGKNSKGCDLARGRKICTCYPGYVPGEYQMCTPMCNDTKKCSNGGSCYSNVCVCKPGTSGPFCDTIDGCSDLKCGNDKTANCSYDEKNFKAFCKCQKWDQVFDYDANICKDCKCDRCLVEFCFSDARKCEFIRGDKVCTCLPSYTFNRKTQTCELCYCGKKQNVESCEFDDDGNTKCYCKYDYKPNIYHDCEYCRCDYGTCEFIGTKKKCTCYSGYSEDGGYCRKCDCGDNGKCVFDYFSRKTKCNCDPNYVEIDGKCLEQKTCYCGENATCTLNSEKKICLCPFGFQDINGICSDINECHNSTACPTTTRCINTIGSYECVCKDGFKLSNDYDLSPCEDIDECLDSGSCPRSDTMCLNTVGSYRCVCKQGYHTRGGIDNQIACENKSKWKLGYGFLIGISVAVILGLMLVIYRKYRT